jgi:hypothetical protein
MFHNGALILRTTTDRPPRIAARPKMLVEPPSWPASHNPHSHVPLKSSNIRDWRPKVGERTSDEYGSFFSETDILGSVDVKRERRARVPAGEPKAPDDQRRQTGLGRRLRHSEQMPDQIEPRAELPEVFRWVPRLGSTRTPDGQSGLGRRLRLSEPRQLDPH